MFYGHLRKLFYGILLTFLEVSDRASHIYEADGGYAEGQNIDLRGLVYEIVGHNFTERTFWSRDVSYLESATHLLVSRIES